MPRITYMSVDGAAHVLDVPLGTSLMQAAVTAGIDGIVGECGGSCMCATCHVYVAEERLADLPPMSATEDAMLDSTASERQPNSRLGCQLVVGPAMEALVVHMPEAQL
jgi:2Fe-2S ferredoxin